MSGVRVRTVEDYLRTLVDRGHGVAICEQTEDPAAAHECNSKAVIWRQVTRLVTRGTVTEDKLLTPSRSNHLMALARVKGDAGKPGGSPAASGNGVALLVLSAARSQKGDKVAQRPGAGLGDISTGTFRLAETDAIRLVAEVMRIDPQELIVADSVIRDETLRPGFDQLGLLKTIDHTVTGGGARLLAERLTSPLTDPDGINHRLDAVSWFLADAALADATRKVLRGSADMPRGRYRSWRSVAYAPAITRNSTRCGRCWTNHARSLPGCNTTMPTRPASSH